MSPDVRTALIHFLMAFVAVMFVVVVVILVTFNGDEEAEDEV